MGRRVRFAVFGALLLLQGVTIGALWSVSGQASEAAVETHLETLLSTASEQAAIHTTNFIRPAEDTITLTAELIGAEGVGAENLEDSLLTQLERHPQLSGLYVAEPDGRFLFVARDGAGFQTKVIDISGGVRSVMVTNRNANRVVTETRPTPDDAYDPTTRPWYAAAIESGGALRWTDPYVFFTSRQLGTTAVTPVVVDGGVVAVVGADIELNSLSHFLTTLPLGESGGAIITTAGDQLIAHPMPEMTWSESFDGEPRANSIEDLEDLTARNAHRAIRAVDAPDGVVTVFENDRGIARAVAQSVSVGASEWSIVIHAYEGDFVGGIQDAQARDRQLLLGIGILALGLGAGAVFPATKPLERLAREATTDPLTQMENRRSILAKADVAAKAKGDRCFAMIDLDGFRHVNDRFGHVVGDEVLEAIAGRLLRTIRPEDAIGRIGGEEFLLLISGADWEQAQPIIERARNAIRATPVVTSAGAIHITASIGVVSTTAEGERASLLAAAARALSDAKRLGRDRVRLVRLADSGSVLSGVTVDLRDDTAVTRVPVIERSTESRR